MTPARSETPSFRSMEPMCRRTVTGAMPSSAAISAVFAPRRSSSITSDSRIVERDALGPDADERAARLILALQLGEEPRNETPRDGRLAAKRAANDVREPLGIEALRQVAGRAAAHRRHELLLVGAVRENDDHDRRRLRDDLRGRPHPVRSGLEAEQADVRTLADGRGDGPVGIHRLAATRIALERQPKPRTRRPPLSSDQHTRRRYRPKRRSSSSARSRRR